MLMPRQSNKGGGTVQVGRLNGNVTVINHHHASGPSRGGRASAAGRRATPAQREVLDLLNRVPDRIAILKFMEKEFKTRLVIELQPDQLYRVKRYVQAVLTNSEAPVTLEPPPVSAFQRERALRLANEADEAQARRLQRSSTTSGRNS